MSEADLAVTDRTECLNCLGGGGYDVPTINGTVWQECDCCDEGEMTEEQERKWLAEWVMSFVEYGDDSEGEPREHELMRRVRWYLSRPAHEQR